MRSNWKSPFSVSWCPRVFTTLCFFSGRMERVKFNLGRKGRKFSSWDTCTMLYFFLAGYVLTLTHIPTFPALYRISFCHGECVHTVCKWVGGSFLYQVSCYECNKRPNFFIKVSRKKVTFLPVNIVENCWKFCHAFPYSLFCFHFALNLLKGNKFF